MEKGEVMEIFLEKDIVFADSHVPKKLVFRKVFGYNNLCSKWGLEGVPIFQIQTHWRNSVDYVAISPEDFDKAAKSGEEKILFKNMCGHEKPGEKEYWAAVYLVKGNPWKVVVEIKAPQEDLISIEVNVPEDISDMKKAYVKR